MLPLISVAMMVYNREAYLETRVNQIQLPSRFPAFCSLAASIPIVFSLLPGVAFAQSITPANDGTNTTVIQNGNQYTITGGQQSNSGSNLFQSFQQFGLNSGEVANFLATPQIQNILGRVTGGNASTINGLIQVLGSNANLYLVNPAGIIFGPNASLNVSGAFTATTATGIGFGNEWFNAIGANNYAALVGNPTNFAFALSQPGSIVNAGNLSVGQGQSLNLIGGTVVNTGTLTAPGGTVTLTAVPGSTLVRLSQAGSLLSLEFQPSSLPQSSLTPASLPQLLTGGNITNATGLTVNPNGTVSLTGSGVTIPTAPGTAIAAGTLNASGNATGGTVTVVGDRVGVISGTIDASGTNGGGSIQIGGGYQGQGTIPNAQVTYVSPDSEIRADSLFNGNGGRVIVWSDEATRFYGTASIRGGNAGGNGGFAEISGQRFLDYRGTVNALAPLGQAGTLLLDPTNIEVVATGTGAGYATSLADVDQFTDPNLSTGTSLVNVDLINNATANVALQATNDITFNAPVNILGVGIGLTAQAGNNITVNEPITTNGGNVTLIANDPASGSATGTGSLFLNNTIIYPPNTIYPPLIATNGGNFTASGFDIIGGSTYPNPSFSIFTNNGVLTNGNGGDITIDAVRNILGLDQFGANGYFRAAGNITLNAGGSIGSISSSSRISFGAVGNITLNAGGSIRGISADPYYNGGNTGNISLTAGDTIVADGLYTTGGDITLNAGKHIAIIWDISAYSSNDAGNISLTSGGDILSNWEIRTQAINGRAGSFNATARNNIQINSVTIESNTGGEVIFNAGKNISIGNISVFNRANSDDVTLNAGGDIAVGRIAKNGGDVTLNAGGNILGSTVSYIISTFTRDGNAGNITLNAGGEVRSGSLYASFYSGPSGNAGSGGNITINAGSGSPYNSIAIVTSSENGNAGNVNVTTGGSLFATIDANSTNGNAGNVNLAVDGSLAGRIDASSSNGNAGNVNLTVGGTIDEYVFANASNGNAGNIDAVAGGAISSFTQSRPGGSRFSAVSTNGYGGNISLRSGETIFASTDTRATNGNAGNITLQANGDIITADQGLMNASATNGTAGNISLIAGGNIVAPEVLATSYDSGFAVPGGGGTIVLDAGGDITNTLIRTGADKGSAGDIRLTAGGNITTDEVLADFFGGGLGSSGSGGNITFTAGGTITNSVLNARSNSGNGGKISLTAGNDIITGRLLTDFYGGGSGFSGEGGDIILTAGGNITHSWFINTMTDNGNAGDITLSAGDSITANEVLAIFVGGGYGYSGSGGNVSLTAVNNLTVGNVGTWSNNGNGGNISLIAGTEVIAGTLDSSAIGGNAGNIFIDPSGDVEVKYINAQGGVSGRGGNVDITAGRFFRATDTFTSADGASSSISTSGGAGGGSITIRHGGAQQNTPFIVGDASTNGTAGQITSGSSVLTSVQSFDTSVTQGNITLSAGNGPGCGLSCQTSASLPGTLITSSMQSTLDPALAYITFIPVDPQLNIDPNGQEQSLPEQMIDHNPNPHLEKRVDPGYGF